MYAAEMSPPAIRGALVMQWQMVRSCFRFCSKQIQQTVFGMLVFVSDVKHSSDTSVTVSPAFYRIE